MSVMKCGSSCCMASFGTDHLFSVTMFWEESNFVLAANLREFGFEEVTVHRSNRRELLIVGESHYYCSGRFMQTVQLPENVNVEETVTLIHDGMLTVTVPVTVRRRRKKIAPAWVTGCRRRWFL